MARMADNTRDVLRQSMCPFSEIVQASILIGSYQGYELSEEELHISLDEFREKFSDANGAPEYDIDATPALKAT